MIPSSLAATNTLKPQEQEDLSEFILKKDGFKDESYVGTKLSKRKVTTSKASGLHK